MESKIQNANTMIDIEIKSDSESEKSIEEIGVEIPEDTNKCKFIKSIYGSERYSTIFFQYNLEATSLNKKITNNKRFLNLEDINWKDKKYRNYCVMYKAYKNIPDCILIPMNTNGIVRTKSFLQANLIWKLLKIDKMSVLIKKLNKYQRYNHFPSTWQLGRKDNLWKNFKVMAHQFPEDYNYIPESFVLPEDRTEMLKRVTEGYVSTEDGELLISSSENQTKTNLWMIKPVASSRGRGIRLLTNIDNIPRKCLISKYIDNPHLINNKKYDLRLYVIITGFSPLKIYLYDEGLTRFASEDYSVDETNKHNRYMHLTNYSVNKCSSHFDKNISSLNECTGSKWSLTALRNYFKSQNLNFEDTWTKIRDIVVKSVISIYEDTVTSTKKLTKHKNTLFELYGFDILIDDNLTPWLIEINLNPSLNCESELDLKVKTSLMTDIFTLVGLVPYSHTGNSKSRDPKLLQDLIINSIENDKNIENSSHKDRDLQNCDTVSIFTADSGDATINKKENPYEQIIYSMDEFSRQGMFHRLFPLKENIDYYSKFIQDPTDDNILLWKYMKNEFDLDNSSGRALPERIFHEDSNI